MSSRADRIQPITQPPPAAVAPAEEEILQSSIRAGSIAQVVVAAVAVIGLIYLLKLVMITTLTGILLAAGLGLLARRPWARWAVLFYCAWAILVEAVSTVLASVPSASPR